MCENVSQLPQESYEVAHVHGTVRSKGEFSLLSAISMVRTVEKLYRSSSPTLHLYIGEHYITLSLYNEALIVYI
jgi:hypothetical protein